MAIINTLSEGQFIYQWPESRRNQFSRDALVAIYEHLEQLSEDIGEPIEYDPIAICCDYTEYESAMTCINDCGYDFEVDKDATEEEAEEAALEWLREQTTVIEFNGGIVIQQF